MNLLSCLFDYFVTALPPLDYIFNELFLIEHCDSPNTVESLDYSHFLPFVVGELTVSAVFTLHTSDVTPVLWLDSLADPIGQPPG